jgi:hypothetical protein
MNSICQDCTKFPLYDPTASTTAKDMGWTQNLTSDGNPWVYVEWYNETFYFGGTLIHTARGTYLPDILT